MNKNSLISLKNYPSCLNCDATSKKQEACNKEHGITPKTIKKNIAKGIEEQTNQSRNRKVAVLNFSVPRPSGRGSDVNN